MSEPMQLHWSQISMYTRCAEQFRRRYIMGEKLPPGVALIIGSGFHRGVEATLRHKIETQELPPEEKTQQAARDCVAKAFEDEVFVTEDDAGKNKDAMRDEAIASAVACASLHRKELAPDVTPIAVERPWVVDIEGYPVSLAGTIDCDEGNTIDDWKTAGKTPSAGTTEESGQVVIYSLAKFTIDKIIPKFRMGYVIKTKIPKTLWQETTCTMDDFPPMLRVIERISEAIRKEVFPFASAQSPRPWCCSPKYCGFYATCEGVSKRKVFAA
jgi:hypothetical protein